MVVEVVEDPMIQMIPLEVQEVGMPTSTTEALRDHCRNSLMEEAVVEVEMEMMAETTMEEEMILENLI
eukprot:1225885-Amphidinium_carterae.1